MLRKNTMHARGVLAQKGDAEIANFSMAILIFFSLKKRKGEIPEDSPFLFRVIENWLGLPGSTLSDRGIARSRELSPRFPHSPVRTSGRFASLLPSSGSSSRLDFLLLVGHRLLSPSGRLLSR
jgi:hypothetical protein